jgi:hypothetical protein
MLWQKMPQIHAVEIKLIDFLLPKPGLDKCLNKKIPPSENIRSCYTTPVVQRALTAIADGRLRGRRMRI